MRAGDVVAGISVAGLMLPEAVAYAGIAGLPPQRAIVAAIAGCLAYAVIGRSRFAVVAPTSSSAAILAAILATFPGDAAARAGIATVAVAAAGVVFLIAWVARLGLLTGFIARPVLRGFAFGLAVTIILHQIPTITGVPIEAPDLPRFAVALARSVGDWQPLGLAAGGLALAALIAARRVPMVPGAFVVVVVGSSLAWAFDLPGHGLAVVGPVTLLPTLPSLPALSWPTLSHLVQMILPLVLILFAESWGTMRTLALRHGDTIVPDRELAALGLANLAAALVQGLPVGAGFSAGSANETAGATSRWAAVIAAIALAALVVSAAPLIAHLPEAVLAAVVIAALAHALDPGPILRLWRIDRDQWVALGAAVAVILFGVVDGMMLAVVFSVGALLRRLALPQITRLGCLPGTRDFADLARHPEAKSLPRIGIWRPSEPLFFANAERVLGTIGRAAAADPDVRVVVLSLEETFDLDSTALEALIEADARIRAGGRALRLARARDPVRDLLVAAGAADLAARSSYSVDAAVAAAQAALPKIADAPSAAPSDDA
ncbi:SulP family inorganic anion transporter [Siculibacillus lacustris]|uniref:SulP family inorganic anion transporter n=1 Tax=Siculibacillus lacustris TaxID=1549641 RepID=A0A4Q9VYV7_9HYPH|nr:SulP family inorganic anion transporter [Siculibacillus lacustris]TBW41374.1 SulP family inorganic anion transporter [Siculibacillus lacustris]